MFEKAEIGGVPNRFTVFVIDFSDGCRYFGWTRDSVASRVAALISDVGGRGANPFVQEHAGGVPYLVRCVASNLDEREARELRNLLVSQAPVVRGDGDGTTVVSSGCRLPRSFAEKEIGLVQTK